MTNSQEALIVNQEIPWQEQPLFKDLFEASRGDLLFQAVTDGDVGLAFNLLLPHKDKKTACSTLLYVTLINKAGNLAQLSLTAPGESIADLYVNQALNCCQIARNLLNPGQVEPENQGQVFIAAIEPQPELLKVFRAERGKEIEQAKALSITKGQSRLDLIEVEKADKDALASVGYSEQAKIKPLVEALRALEKQTDNHLRFIWQRHFSGLTALHLKYLESYKSNRRRLEQEYNIPINTSWIEKLGIGAIGEQLSFDFEGDVLVFVNDRLPDGYALCMDRLVLMALKSGTIEKGKKVSFCPINADGYLVPDEMEFEINEQTRLIRREEMEILPPVYVCHSTTQEQFDHFISLIGLYSRGEAILSLVIQKYGQPRPEFYLPSHDTALIFYCPPSLIAYQAKVGESDGLSICNKIPADRIPPVILDTVDIGGNRLTDGQGFTYHLGKEYLVSTRHRTPHPGGV